MCVNKCFAGKFPTDRDVRTNWVLLLHVRVFSVDFHRSFATNLAIFSLPILGIRTESVTLSLSITLYYGEDY